VTRGAKPGARLVRRVAQPPNWEDNVKAISRLAACTAIALAFGALSPAVTTVASAGGKNSCYSYKDKERAFARKINGARTSRGTRRVSLDKELSRVARRHTWEMDNHNSLFHTSSFQLRRRVTRWRVLGENVGIGQSVSSLHRAFMASPAHKANVMRSDFRHVGVGVRRASTGQIWVTIIFEGKRDPGTRLRMCN
jgi:uncharacterized protein YkwD